MDDNQQATPQPTPTSDLDNLIKSKFKLFQGLRTDEEDQKIYDKVTDFCFDEMIAFLAENLSEQDQESLNIELEKEGTEEDKTKIMMDYMSKIENNKVKLGERLNNFLNKLLLSNLANNKG